MHRRTPQRDKEKIKKQISLLEEKPKHPSLKIHKLEGSEFREFYVDDFYRCGFKQEGNIYKLYFIGTHRLINRFK
jgi:mRNA-degrading endonuclease YafQ of YafQ-DinJ toxin-antitoxin module